MEKMKLDDKEKKILDLALPYIPYYGEFDLLERIKRIDNSKFKEIWENLSNPTEQIINIKENLIDYGFAIKRNDVDASGTYIELKERGRWLKEMGDMESYNISIKQKKERTENENKERELTINRDKQMNLFTLWIKRYTMVAAIYYLLEVLNHIFGFYEWLNHFVGLNCY